MGTSSARLACDARQASSRTRSRTKARSRDARATTIPSFPRRRESMDVALCFARSNASALSRGSLSVTAESNQRPLLLTLADAMKPHRCPALRTGAHPCAPPALCAGDMRRPRSFQTICRPNGHGAQTRSLSRSNMGTSSARLACDARQALSRTRTRTNCQEPRCKSHNNTVIPAKAGIHGRCSLLRKIKRFRAVARVTFCYGRK